MLSIIAAIGQNNALGKDNQLIWHLPADLKRFKKVTTGHHVIMGRKTFESLGNPLPNRTTIIISRDKNYHADGCITVNSLTEAIKAAQNDDNPYILGGAEIYKQSMDIADVLDLTFVHQTFEADVYFPKIDKNIWKETFRENHFKDERNKFDFSFVKYERI